MSYKDCTCAWCNQAFNDPTANKVFCFCSDKCKAEYDAWKLAHEKKWAGKVKPRKIGCVRD